MSDKFAYSDRDADIVWLPTGESSDCFAQHRRILSSACC